MFSFYRVDPDQAALALPNLGLLYLQKGKKASLLGNGLNIMPGL